MGWSGRRDGFYRWNIVAAVTWTRSPGTIAFSVLPPRRSVRVRIARARDSSTARSGRFFVRVFSVRRPEIFGPCRARAGRLRCRIRRIVPQDQRTANRRRRVTIRGKLTIVVRMIILIFFFFERSFQQIQVQHDKYYWFPLRQRQ